MAELLAHERELWARGVMRIAGVDEAGVGPLAGPVVAAAVVFAPHTEILGIDDSKRMDGGTRERLAEEIRQRARGYAVGMAEVEEVDRLNIYRAALLAMRRAVEALPEPPQQLLVDARRIPDLALPQTAVAQGDRRHFSIAAASILAKTHRDRFMVELDRRHPGYGFARHKGYPTADHRAALTRLGASPIHRRSFPAVAEATGDGTELYLTLWRAVQAATAPATLDRLTRAITAARQGLAPAELRKLRLLLRRKRPR
jgi:ribonuclease HII